MFDDFDLFETCEEYYNEEEYEAFEYELSEEDQTELDTLFG